MNRAEAVAVVSDAVAGLVENRSIGTLLQGRTGDWSDEDWARLEAAKDCVALRLFRMGKGGRA